MDHNKPDIVVIEKDTNNAYIIDVAIPNDHNITRKRLEKLRAYTDLAVEIKTMWNLATVKVIPVIIGATGMYHKAFDDDIKKLNLLEKHFNKSHVQKITLIGTAHIVRSFLQIA